MQQVLSCVATHEPQDHRLGRGLLAFRRLVVALLFKSPGNSLNKFARSRVIDLG